MSRLNLIALVCAVAFVASMVAAEKLPANAKPDAAFLAKYDEIKRNANVNMHGKYSAMIEDAGANLDCDTDYSDPKLAEVANVLRACHTAKELCTVTHDRFIHNLMNKLDDDQNMYIYVEDCKHMFSKKCREDMD